MRIYHQESHSNHQFNQLILDSDRIHSDHAGYDYVDYSNDETCTFSKDQGATTQETIQNPYYGGEVDTNDSESIVPSNVERNSLRENIKVTQNPYYT